MRTAAYNVDVASDRRRRKNVPGHILSSYGDEENARIYAVHLTTADQSEIRRAYLVSVRKINYNEKYPL